MKKKMMRVLAVSLVLIGLFLLLLKPLRNFLIRNTGEHYQISKVTRDEIKKNQEKEASFDVDKVKSLNSQEVVASQVSGKAKDLPVIASVAVPKVGIQLPVFKGLSNDGLFYGAGTLFPNQEMGVGNYLLVSHHSDQAHLLFTPLEQVSIGDKIYLTDLENIYCYETTLKKVIDPSDWSVTEAVEGKVLVTLITCGDLYATTRLVVQGELISVTPMTQMTTEMVDAFGLATNSY